MIEPDVQDLPTGWIRTELGKLTAIGSRITYGIVQPGVEDRHGVLLVRGGDIFQGNIDIARLRTVTAKVSSTSPRTLLRGGELLMSLVGYPGEVALVPPELAGANIARQVACIRLDDQIDANYLSHYLRSDLGRHYLFQKATGSAQQVINLADLKDVAVILAPLIEQKQIAAVLSCMDQLIDATTAKVERLKNLKIGMIQELLNRGCGHQTFQLSPVGIIPQPWEITTLGKTARSLQTGPFGSQLHAHEYVPAGTPVVMPRDMKDQIIDTSVIAHISPTRAAELDRFQLQPGDILFSRRGDIARSVLVNVDNTGWICGTGCLRARLGPRLLPEFFIYYLILPNVVEWLHNHAVGQTMPNLNMTILSDLPVLVPPLAEQQIIANTMQSLNNVLRATESKLRQLHHIKKSLMQNLLTGRVQITH